MKPDYVPVNWENVNCPFCYSAEKCLYEKFGSSLQFSYVKCSSCGLIYQSPRPLYDEAFLKAAYGDYFVFDKNYIYSKKEQFEFSEELSEIIHFDKKREYLLDIGSCMGGFLKEAKNFYKSVEGLEISDNMAEFTENNLGTKIYRCQFTKLQTDRKYSCIHMSHVLEHVPNPAEWMDKASFLLDGKGVLVISVPNMFSVARRFKHFLYEIGLRGNTWKEAWRTPDHLFEPTIPSMKQFCQRAGFTILSYYTYSRKDPVAKKFHSRIIQRALCLGSNLRFYLRKI